MPKCMLLRFERNQHTVYGRVGLPSFLFHLLYLEDWVDTSLATFATEHRRAPEAHIEIK